MTLSPDTDLDWTLNEYQHEAMNTSADLTTTERTFSADEQGLILSALGLAGESGEMADHIKKWMAQGHELDFQKLDKEAGDILWYLARYAHARHTTLDKIARENRRKLMARYPSGFDTQRSLNRPEGTE